MPSRPLQHFMIFIRPSRGENGTVSFPPFSGRERNGTVSQMSQNAEQALLSPAIDPPAPDQPENAGENLSDEDDDADAATDKKKRPERDWELIGRWNPATDDKAFIDAEIARIAKEKMAVCCVTKLHLTKSKPTDLSMWKLWDTWPVSDTSFVHRYRCPLSSRFKCPALLKIERRDTVVQMFESKMHTVESHDPGKDRGKYLKHHQKELVTQAVSLNPTASSAQLRRNIHRSSPDKQILPKHKR